MVPDKVKVGGITYVINHVEIPNEMDHNTDGQILYSIQEIKLKKGMAVDYTEHVFCHELVHAILNHCGIELDKDKEENYVDRIAHCLHQILKDNNIRFD